MSYYYNYYIGYKKEGKIYPLGPYNSFGKLNAALWRSRSFASRLHEEFNPIKEEEISEELRKEFEYTDWEGKKTVEVKLLPLSMLPTDSYLKSGYFLISDVELYEKDHDEEGLFYDCLSPQIYAAKLQHELTFGKPAQKLDEEGEEITEHSASEYMYYVYPDYRSKEYEASVIREIANALNEYTLDDEDIVILETEG